MQAPHSQSSQPSLVPVSPISVALLAFLCLCAAGLGGAVLNLRDELKDPATRDAVRVALATVRGEIGFMARDRAMDGDVVRICALVERGALRTAA